MPDDSRDERSIYDQMISALERGDDVESVCARYPELAKVVRALGTRAKSIPEETLSPSRAETEPTRPVTPRSDSGRRRSGDWRQLIERLRTTDSHPWRYEDEAEIARGGMGVVRRVRDVLVRRQLAMKVIRGQAGKGASGATPVVDDRTIARFLDEARITGQLEHPGIVPVHDLGIDAEGRFFFTMKLVNGEDLSRIIERAQDGSSGWSVTRVVSLLLRVCEAMAFAHSRGVIHRDLKPANVMIGGFGEVYVMDWGLARFLDEPDGKDIRLRPPAGDARRARPSGESQPDPEFDPLGADESPLVTMDGDVVGTPAYMPPEQARGEIDRLGPWSDVYAVGAMLYHLLAGRQPYADPSRVLGNHAVLSRLLDGPPAPLADAAPTAPAELVSICEKAMDREISRRYPSTAALSEDLRAFLESHVVGAYETGAFARLRKLIWRNRLLATTAAVAIASVLVLAGWALRERARAMAGASAAVAERARVFRVSAVKTLADLRREWETLWPATSGNVGAMRRWLERARELVSARPEHEQVIAELRAHGTAQPDGLRYDFAGDVESLWWHDTLVELVGGLDELAQDDVWSPTIRSMESRLAFATTIEQRSLRDAAEAWAAAIEGVAEFPDYSGLVLAPQLGLIPIGADPVSGLQEFAHVQSGEPPKRDPFTGRLAIAAESAICFVLVPGGTLVMGAQSADPRARNFDPQAASDESPIHEVTLDPFFLSKYETTAAQWERLTGASPSSYVRGHVYDGDTYEATCPVDMLSWRDCHLLVSRLGTAFSIPTEAQWEYACRAGSATVWWCGNEPTSLAGCANIADRHCKLNGGNPNWEYQEDVDDGFARAAPVGSFSPNAFGLHDMHGNIAEWCRDLGTLYEVPTRAGDGERIGPSGTSHVIRGGSFSARARDARSAARAGDAPDYRFNALGIRLARAIEAAPAGR